MDDTLSLDERTSLDTLLVILSKQKRWDWPVFKPLSGYPGLGEIRFYSEQRTPLRLLGMQDQPGEYILLVGCSHKGRVYDPPNAMELAVKRKKSYINKTGGSICDHD